MAKTTIRTVQPAHKSDKITVMQAQRAWQKVRHQSIQATTSKRVDGTHKAKHIGVSGTSKSM